VQPSHVPYAHAYAYFGVDLARPLWIRTAKSADALWSAEQILRTGSCSVLVLWQNHIRAESLRRLLLAAQSADTLKKLSLELGGNAPFIVFDDADLDAAVQGAMASKFRNTGQTCVCVNRFFVQAGVYAAFTQRLTEAVRKLRVGDALEQEVDQGPLINEAAFRKVGDHVADALSKGASALIGGHPHALGGTFFEPTVLVHANRTMLIAQEETFGPVAACFRFETEAEAITLANDTPFGLAAYFYTRDLGRAWRVADALETGMVGINEGIISTEVAPFGGVKQSGLGREGSKYGLDEYMEMKYMMISGLMGIER